MKELLEQYAKYNIWANRQLITVLSKLDETKRDMEMVSSFPTISKTVAHTWGAEDIWMQRLNLVEQPVWVAGAFEGSFKEVLENWQAVSKGLLAFIEKQFSDDSFQHVMQYYNLQKQSVKIPVYAALMQVFNHASYHRGQLVTMLRQAGIRKIPATDFYVFAVK